MSSFFSYMIVGISVQSYLSLIVLVALGYFLGWVLSKVVKRYALKRMQAGVDQEGIQSLAIILANSASGPIRFGMLILGLWIALKLIPTPSWGEGVFYVLFLLIKGISIWLLVWFLLKATQGFKAQMALRASKTEEKMDDMIIPILFGLLRFAIVMVGILLVLQNLGYSVTSILAGLGLGGVAVALAAKDTLSNFFGSLVVFFDRPFEIGDWVVINGVDGMVEEIRLRTTIIRTWDRSVVTMPNAQLTTANINNYQRMNARKMSFIFGVYYSTKSSQLEEIINNVRKFISENQDLFDGDGAVGFDNFGDSSLEVSVTAYSRATGKAAHMAVKERLLLEIMHIVESAGTGFAFPTRTLELTEDTLKRLGK